MSTHRQAFTLLELLLCISVVVTLIGLTSQAVQRARAAAARVSCMNNLKQLALACHNYGTTLDRWPGGGTGWNSSQDGWLWQMRDYWEVNERIVWCPVRGRGRTWDNRTCTDYVAAIPTGFAGQPYTNEATPLARQVFPSLITPNDRPLYPTRLSAQSERGLSNTLLIGHSWQFAPEYGGTVGYHGSWTDGFGITTVRSTASPPHPDSTFAAGWDYTFGGPHAGVPMALGDGSVQLISFAIDPLLWRDMSHR